MKVLALDPKRTHDHNPNCPSRLVHIPGGKDWMCFDCGCQIVLTMVEVMPVPGGASDFERDPRT